MPVAAARKSARRLNRSMGNRAEAGPAGRSRTQPLAPVRATRRQHLAAAFGRHAGAKAMAALAHQFAGLIGPFHGICLRCARHANAGAQLARLIRDRSALVNGTRPSACHHLAAQHATDWRSACTPLPRFAQAPSSQYRRSSFDATGLQNPRTSVPCRAMRLCGDSPDREASRSPPPGEVYGRLMAQLLRPGHLRDRRGRGRPAPLRPPPPPSACRWC